MSPNILITGGSGYIGGTLIHDLVARNSSVIDKNNVIATVRSDEQAALWTEKGVNNVRGDLNEEDDIHKIINKSKIDIVVHTAGSFLTPMAKNIINALAGRQEGTGRKTYFIHTSGLSAFYPASGWTHGRLKDTDEVYQLEKQVADSWPVRETDVAVVEHAKEKGVTLLIVVPPLVYGKGRGVWNKQSAQFAACINAALKNKVVNKFPTDGMVLAVHISDLTALYIILLERIITEQPIPTDEGGYYFSIGHKVSWWQLLDKIAEEMHSRGLVTESGAQLWENEEVAAQNLETPVEFTKVLYNAGVDVVAENSFKVGWRPQNKDVKSLLKCMAGEIQLALDSGGLKSSLLKMITEHMIAR